MEAQLIGFSSEFISLPFNILLRGDALKGPEGLDAASQAVLQRFKRYCDDYLRLERLTSRRLELAPLAFMKKQSFW